jgi:hypothetical protein
MRPRKSGAAAHEIEGCRIERRTGADRTHHEEILGDGRRARQAEVIRYRAQVVRQLIAQPPTPWSYS